MKNGLCTTTLNQRQLYFNFRRSWPANIYYFFLWWRIVAQIGSQCKNSTRDMERSLLVKLFCNQLLNS